MKIKCAQRRHLPDYFGKHSEGYHHEERGIDSLQLLDEVLVFQSDRLQHGDVVFYGINLDGRLKHMMTAPGRLVGHRDNGGHLMAGLDYCVETCYSKLGCSEKYYFHFVFG